MTSMSPNGSEPWKVSELSRLTGWNEDDLRHYGWQCYWTMEEHHLNQCLEAFDPELRQLAWLRVKHFLKTEQGYELTKMNRQSDFRKWGHDFKKQVVTYGKSLLYGGMYPGADVITGRSTT